MSRFDTCPKRMGTCVRMRDGSARQKCYRCGTVKRAAEFAWRRRARNQRDSFCRPCRSAYKHEHYTANRQRYVDQAGVRKRRLFLERTTYLIDLFATHPCVDCGESDPVVLEFELYARTVIAAAQRDVAARLGSS